MEGNVQDGYWAGIDWGESTHAVTIVDGGRRIRKSFTVPHSVAGMEALSAALACFQPLRGIAVESTRNLLIAHLLADGYVLYPINPKMSAAWRKGDSVAGCKSDERDGRVLARELAVRWEQLAPMWPEGDEVRELALLCEHEQRLIEERTRHILRLQSTLKLYFPAALEFFSDWKSPTAWDWLKVFPTAEKFAKASNERLYQFLRTHSIGITPQWRARVEKHGDAAKWAVSIATSTAYSMRAIAEVCQLITITEQLNIYRKRIEALFAQREDHVIFDSLPGAGKKLAPRLFTIFGTDRSRYVTPDPLRLLSGVAPVMKQSGKKSHVTIRRACKKPWRNTMHQFALCSKKYCPWAKAFYDHRRAQGDGDAQALRKLADKWLKIIHRMWRERAPYNEAKYIESLYKRKSPLVAYLPVDNPVENS